MISERRQPGDQTRSRRGERGDLAAEPSRLKGALLSQQPASDSPQAKAYYQQVITVPRRQQAKSYELRTAMSLSRLWQQQGQRDEARELLAPIYG
jgi:predicted ATPase